MKRLGRAIEIAAWVVFFAVALAALALRYWVLPEIDRFREPIAAALSRAIGLPVRVGAIEAGWPGLRLHVRLIDVRIQDAQGREALALPSIENVLSWRALARGEFGLDRLVIEAPKLAVRRDPGGELYVAGLRLAPGAAANGGGFGAWLLAQPEVEVHRAEIEWRDELRAAPPLLLSGVELRLLGGEGAASVGLKAQPPAELGGALEARALLHPSTLGGQAFVQLEHIDLAAWQPWVEYPFEVRQGHGAVRLWATLDQGRLSVATADVALADVRASLGEGLAPLELASVRGRLQGRTLPDGVMLSGRGIAAELEGRAPEPATDFDLVWRPQADGTVTAGTVDLEAMRLLAGALPLPAQVARAIAELAPQGRLTGSRLQWRGPIEAPTELEARTSFAGLAIRPRDGVPGFSGLSGTLEATLDGGRLALAARDAVLEVTRVLPQPVVLDSLSGEIAWRRDAAGSLVVSASSLSFANPHLSGNLFGTWASRGDGPGSIDLSAILARADAAAIERYLPHPEIMGEGVRRWLVAGILAGEASDVRFRLRGDLRDFPFTDPARGDFLITAHVEKGVLDYAPGWPRIEAIDADLRFERDRMDIVGRSGTILGAALSGVRVSIPKFVRGGTRVLVSGQAEGPTAAFLEYLESSPLDEDTGGFAGDMRAEGNGRLRLKLELPLAALDKSRVDGEFAFADNRVVVMPGLPAVEAAGGRVLFGRDQFRLDGVRGRALGGEVAVSGGANRRRGLDIRAQGEAAFDATRELFDHPIRRYLSGSFDYALAVQAKDGPARVRVESSLRGLASVLPAPLTKPAGESLPLRVERVPAARGERDRLVATLGRVARFEAARRREGDAMRVQRAAVWLGYDADKPIRLPERPGILVYGSLASFDVDRWLALPRDDAGTDQPVAIDVKVGRLDAFGRRFGNVALRASAEPGGWSANVSADEVAGDVSYRAGAEPLLVARLARFTVPADTPGAASQEPPRDLPALDFVAEAFTFRGKPLGRVELKARRDGDDWRIESASMTNPDATLAGHGVWRTGASRTAVEFDLQANDVGGFLGRVGHRDLVKGGQARLTGQLDWQGDPATLHFPTLSGALNLQAKDGQFLEIEPGIGKLIALMSLQALPRRITLDFRDVFSKGFRFDTIDAAAQVQSGVIRVEDFRMRGSAAEVQMRGEADIVRETQDLRVRVVPSLDNTASLATTIVNPFAGVALVIAQRLLKNPLGQMFAFDYDVSGSWSDPKVTKIQPELPAHVGQ